jgi:hypothetical protein
MNKITIGLESSTFHKMCANVYKDENNIIVETCKIGSCNYVTALFNNLIFLPSQNGGTKFAIKETLKYISEFLMKYDITQLNQDNISDNLHIRDELSKLNKFIARN